PRPGLASRLAYNLRLPLRFDPAPFDLVVGFDFDGCFVPRSVDAPPFLASLKGIAADEQRFEAGTARARLCSQAAMEAWSVARADAVVVPSRYSAGWARRAYGAPADRTGVVPEGIDLGRWGLGSGPDAGAPDPGGADRGPVILSVARQYRRKRTGLLIDAVARLVRDGVPARLRVIGGGPELERLRARAAASGLGGRVRFDGDRPPDEVREAYRDADLFCLPSVQEGFGIVFLEAMAAGLPVVACRAGAAPEVLVEGETGLLAEPDDRLSLARTLRPLLRRPDLRRSMGARGRRRAARFGWPQVARRFLSTCRRLLPNLPSRAPRVVRRGSNERC
ncbi:MAG: glycosyltransferase family 4 protein, partial [Gemmatimonadota bacterium]